MNGLGLFNEKDIDDEVYKIKINNFEGPFALLFHLIEKNQMNIYDIPINEITNQYMDYLYSMKEWDLEISSEFLVMAATLLHIKSRMLLPSKKEETEEEDPRLDLVYKLVEYKKYLEVSKELLKREQEWYKALYKTPEPISFTYEEELLELSADVLRDKMDMLIEINKRKRNDNSKRMQKILQHEKVSLGEKIREIVGFISKRTKAMFSDIFKKDRNSKLELVTGFQAVLELSKMRKIKIKQDKPFEDIQLERIDA